MALAEVNAVTKSYARRTRWRTEQVAVVEDVSLTIEAGETLALGGAGSGKTTLARMVLGLVKPTSGTARVAGVDVERCAWADAALNPRPGG